jgi:hypothetical protein
MIEQDRVTTATATREDEVLAQQAIEEPDRCARGSLPERIDDRPSNCSNLLPGGRRGHRSRLADRERAHGQPNHLLH